LIFVEYLRRAVGGQCLFQRLNIEPGVHAV
jgi:hypothetical protein